MRHSLCHLLAALLRLPQFDESKTRHVLQLLAAPILEPQQQQQEQQEQQQRQMQLAAVEVFAAYVESGDGAETFFDELLHIFKQSTSCGSSCVCLLLLMLCLFICPLPVISLLSTSSSSYSLDRRERYIYIGGLLCCCDAAVSLQPLRSAAAIHRSLGIPLKVSGDSQKMPWNPGNKRRLGFRV